MELYGYNSLENEKVKSKKSGESDGTKKILDYDGGGSSMSGGHVGGKGLRTTY
jgi:hypothetical protein